MAKTVSRRSIFKAGLAGAGLSAVGAGDIRFSTPAFAENTCHAVTSYSELLSCQNVKQGSAPTFNGCGPDPSCPCGPPPRHIPQGYRAVSFTDCCNAHDICYGTCGAD